MGLDGAAGATGDGERGRGEVKGSRSCVRMEVFISSGALWLFEQVGPHPTPPPPLLLLPIPLHPRRSGRSTDELLQLLL